MFTQEFTSPKNLPITIPIFPLSGATLLPRCKLPLNIFEPRYIDMINDALSSHRFIGMVQPDGFESNNKPSVFGVGCLGRITSWSETEDKRYLITLTGISRFDIVDELNPKTSYRQVHARFDTYAHDFISEKSAPLENRSTITSLLERYFVLKKIEADWSGLRTAHDEDFINMLSIVCPFRSEEKQALLQAIDLPTRANVLMAILEMSVNTEMGDGTIN